MKSACVPTRGIVLLCVVAVAGLVVGGCPLPIDVDSLIAQAGQRAQTLDADAIVFQASATRVSGSDALATERFIYSFLAIDPNDPDTSYKLTFDGLRWTSEDYSSTTVGVAWFDLAEVTLTPTAAQALLTDAGHTLDYNGWSLYSPLYPGADAALYAFNYGDETVFVNTETLAVTKSTASETEPPVSTPPGDDSVSLAMLAAADTRIKETDENAFIIWGGGRDGAGGGLAAPADTNTWDFIALRLDGTGTAAWQLTYDGDWTVAEMAGPPFSIEYVDLTEIVTMDVVEAWALALAAGYTPPIGSWEFFKPLNPTAENPVYVFWVDGLFVVVDTVTGEVSQE